MTFKHVRSPLFQILVAFSSLSLVGCGGEGGDPEPNTSTNDIQAFLDENPDAVEKPEDVPADESEVFAAGDGANQ